MVSSDVLDDPTPEGKALDEDLYEASNKEGSRLNNRNWRSKTMNKREASVQNCISNPIKSSLLLWIHYLISK